MNEFFGSEVKWGLAAASLPFLFLLLVFPPLLIAGLILVPAVGLFGWLSPLPRPLGDDLLRLGRPHRPVHPLHLDHDGLAVLHRPGNEPRLRGRRGGRHDMSAIRSDDEARAYVADLSARIAEQTARNQRASEFLDWVTVMLWIGFVFVPMTFAFALHLWLVLAKGGFVLNTVGLLLALVSPFAGVAATAGVIYVLGGPGSPQHLRPRRPGR